MSKNSTLHLVINEEEVTLSKDKVIVGSGENCDIQINHASISHYHALLMINSDGSLSVIDLESANGTFINGVKVGTKSSFYDGDTVTFGKLHCDAVESMAESQFVQTDAEVQVFADLQGDKVYVPERTDENQVLIDDEYCDIVFDDNEFIPFHKNPMAGLHVSEQEFIETESLEEGFHILEETNHKCIQVTTTLNGSMLDQFYFPLQDGTVFASQRPKKNTVVVDILNSEKPKPLFKVENGVLHMAPSEDFNLNLGSMNLSENKVIILSRGTYQVFIEVNDAPNHLLPISSFRRELSFYRDTAKKFAAVILPMLLLLLVDFSVEKKKPLKELSIIYKRPTNANVDGQKMASTNPNDTKKNTGHKEQKQPDKKIAHSKSGAKEQPKKAQTQKVAKSQSKPTKKAKAKTKAYSFKLATNVNSMFSNSKSVAVSNSDAPSTAKTTASVTGSLNTKVDGTSSAQVGQMGSDKAGRALASFGSKGLSSKSGRDTAYIQTETVVLGSMDPELLRKILQQYLPQFRHCYQQELAYNSDDIKGIVDLNFEISPSGRVAKANVKAKDSRFSNKGLDCMKKVLAIIDFPKPKGGGRVAVRQPLSFFSEQEKG